MYAFFYKRKKSLVWIETVMKSPMISWPYCLSIFFTCYLSMGFFHSSVATAAAGGERGVCLCISSAITSSASRLFWLQSFFMKTTFAKSDPSHILLNVCLVQWERKDQAQATATPLSQEKKAFGRGKASFLSAKKILKSARANEIEIRKLFCSIAALKWRLFWYHEKKMRRTFLGFVFLCLHFLLKFVPKN